MGWFGLFGNDEIILPTAGIVVFPVERKLFVYVFVVAISVVSAFQRYVFDVAHKTGRWLDNHVPECSEIGRLKIQEGIFVVDEKPTGTVGVVSLNVHGVCNQGLAVWHESDNENLIQFFLGETVFTAQLQLKVQGVDLGYVRFIAFLGAPARHDGRENQGKKKESAHYTAKSSDLEYLLQVFS